MLKSLKTSAWLGWQIESSWTEPFVFVIYSAIKPIAASLILLFMYLVVTRGKTSSDLFSFVFVGNAFYMYIGGVLFGISWAVIDDREHYETIRYIYISPVRMYTYLVGRGVARFLITTFAVLIILFFGRLVLKIPIHPLTIDYPFLLSCLSFGLTAVVALGLILAGICLVVPRHSWLMNEGVAGVFYLLCGAIFPIDVLPSWLQPISRSLPFTYWLEGMRRATLGKSMSPLLSNFGNGEILWVLIATTIALGVASHLTFKSLEHWARRRGIIDRTTGY